MSLIKSQHSPFEINSHIYVHQFRHYNHNVVIMEINVNKEGLVWNPTRYLHYNMRPQHNEKAVLPHIIRVKVKVKNHPFSVLVNSRKRCHIIFIKGF